jgi:hypothetical protein
MYGGREALPDDHKLRGQRGRVRARYRRPQLGRGTERIGETPTYNSPPRHFLVKLRRSRRQVSARRKLHRAVDAQVATANSIPWSSTAKFSRNGVLVAPLRVSHALLGPERISRRVADDSPAESSSTQSLVPPCFVNQLLDRFAWSVNDRSRSNVSSFDGRHAQEKGRRPSR